VWIVPLLVVIIIVAAVLVFQNSWAGFTSEQNETGFTLVSLANNSVLLSDADVLFFNSTSHEIALTDDASQRLTDKGNDLYNFSNVYVFRVNSEEVYQGIFRSAIMSAVPSPPKIAILYPSFDYLTNTENNHAIRLFYPTFEVPSNQTENYTELTSYFQNAGKVVI
jgi:hypothetical protein